MDALQEVWAQLRQWIEQDWLRNLLVLLILSLLAYLPARLSQSQLAGRWRANPRLADSRGWRIVMVVLESILWPLWALLLYLAFGLLVRRVLEAGGDPFLIMPILLFFLGYRVLMSALAELLPEGMSRRLLRRILLPLVFLLVVLEQLDVLGPVLEWASQPLLKVGKIGISLLAVTLSVGVFLLFMVVARLTSSFLSNRFLPGLGLDRAAASTLSTLVRYTLIGTGLFVALDSLGFDLSTLQIVLGALGVGIGFGLQNFVNNFVSGLVLLVERKLKQGDIVHVSDTEGRILSVGLRSSVVRTRSGREIVVPNSDLTSSQVTNLSLHDRKVRVDLPVGVSYSSDPNQVRELLLRVADEHEQVLKHPPADVLFMAYGESSLDFELRIWTGHLWEIPRLSSDLYYAMWYALADAGVEIPFPQRDLHLRSGVLPVRIVSSDQEPDAAPAAGAGGDASGESPARSA